MTNQETENKEPKTGTVDTERQSGAVEVQEADFAPVREERGGGSGVPIARFNDVQVSVTAELGRAQVPIRKLLQLGAGSVIELDRTISSPVEIIAHGVPLACGEVVVVNDHFAIRISEIYPGPDKAAEKSGASQ